MTVTTPSIRHSPFFDLATSLRWGEHKNCRKCLSPLEDLPNSDHKFYCPKCRKNRVFPKGTLFFEKCAAYETFNNVWVDYKRFWFYTYNDILTVNYGPDSSISINLAQITMENPRNYEAVTRTAVVDAMVELYGDERLRGKLLL